MNILTPEQLAARQRSGWKVFQPGFDMSYKSHWDTPWFFIREYFQNALDEHDEAGILEKKANKEPPLLVMQAKGAVIADKGRGIGAESLLLRETKERSDLRGRFGEGMKFACIAAVRQGYTPVIESANVIIEACVSPLTMGRVEANMLTFLWKEPSKARTGTTVTVEGYHGTLFKDRFTTFLDPPIFTWVNAIGRFIRRYGIYTKPAGRLYVGDIYIRDLEKASYSYNLWDIELNPDRVSEINNTQMKTSIAYLWASLKSEELAKRALMVMSTIGTFENNLTWSHVSAPSDNRKYWVSAWSNLFDQRTVLSTDEMVSKVAESFGYKPVGAKWGYQVTSFLATVVPTDQSIARSRMSELTAPTIVPDEKLGVEARRNLELLRYLANKCGAQCCDRDGETAEIVAAQIPKDPRTGDIIDGLCARTEAIYLSPDVLTTEESSLAVFYHEEGHWVGGTNAVDGSIEHTRAVQQVASHVSIILQKNSAEIERMLRGGPPARGTVKAEWCPVCGADLDKEGKCPRLPHRIESHVKSPAPKVLPVLPFKLRG
jgi:hypothetical protein